MKKVLIIMFLILTGVANIYGKEEAGKKEKISMLAYGAILTVRNEDNFTRLGTDITEDKEILAENWEITNRKQAIDALEWLVNEGHRKESDEVLKILQAGKAGDFPIEEDQNAQERECEDRGEKILQIVYVLIAHDFLAAEGIAGEDESDGQTQNFRGQEDKKNVFQTSGKHY